MHVDIFPVIATFPSLVYDFCVFRFAGDITMSQDDTVAFTVA